MIKITAFPRIHLTLIGLNNGGYRINGGIGFAIKDPAVLVTIEESDCFQIQDNREIKLSVDQLKRLSNCLTAAIRDKMISDKVKIHISGMLPTNCGFGSGTAIRLACLELLFIFNKVAYLEADIIAYSKRGGTSGVGINTYFNGGYSFDVGHKSHVIIPSSVAEKNPRIPLSLDNGKMPNWEFGLCFPKERFETQIEADFFNETIPLSDSKVYEILYHVIYGIYASIRENDLNTFCRAIRAIQNTGWKKAEWQFNGGRLEALSKELYETGAFCVGLSSLGPMLFFVSPNIQETENTILRKRGDDFNIMRTSTINHGRVIEHV